MKKTDLKGATVLMFVRFDTIERVKNFHILVRYYKKYFTNFKFIFSEECPKRPQVPFELNENFFNGFNLESDEFELIWKSVSDKGVEWNKCAAYNRGIKLSQSDVIIFNDLDAIIHPNQMMEAVDTALESENLGFVFPYNGEFLCIDQPNLSNAPYQGDLGETRKKRFNENLDIEILFEDYEQCTKQVGSTYSEGLSILVGSTTSVGGCVVGRRDNLVKCNGYNPKFIGWGYEDNECPARVHRLGYEVRKLGGTNQPLFHLPHSGPGESKRETNPHHENNRQHCSYVEANGKKEMEEYIKTWKL
tara:strand:- start:2119 stop:3030 length:912 start_codon:yes stop_codon:yes gene_type:complete